MRSDVAASAIDARAFGIRICRQQIEGELLYEASVREFPDLYAYSEEADEAYAFAVDAIETAISALLESGNDVPAPSDASDAYSGRVTLRLPKSLHRSLVLRAEEEGVSLNTLLVAALAHAV